MLTVRKIGVTVGESGRAMEAAMYSLDFADSPQAFASDSEGAERANTMWLGSPEALRQVGVRRGTEVKAEELAQALQGRHAVTGAEVRKPGTRDARDENGVLTGLKESRVNSMDMTLSLPKSVAIAWSQANPEMKRQIERKLLIAANGMLDYMLFTKPVVQGAGDLGHGYAAAVALHVTSRTAKGDSAPAPQLHVHCTVVGVLNDQGKVRTADPAALFKNDAPLEGAAIGRAWMAKGLRDLGFDLDHGTGRNKRFFEIKGIPTALIQLMSPRAREVEREIARLETERGETLRGKERAAVALMIRQSKKAHSASEIKRHWLRQTRRFGIHEAQVDALAATLTGRPPLVELLGQARATILERIWENGPTVSIGVARQIAINTVPMGLTVEQATGLLERMQSDGDLIALEGGRVTSREIREAEQLVMRVATEAGEQSRRGLSPTSIAAGKEVASRSLGEGLSLDEEQLKAVDTLTGGSGWTTLTGRAGTGKGPVLEAVAAAHRQDGWRVIACALDGATKERLGHQIDSSALTIAQVLARVRHGSLDLGERDGRTLILIDEASKVGLRHWEQLARLVEEHGVRLVAIGHDGQLGAIELPGMFTEMLRARGIPKESLTEIRRHRNPKNPKEVHPWLADYQIALDKGQADEAIGLLRHNDAISMYDTRDEATEAMVDGWDERRRQWEDPRAAIMVVHGANEDVDWVNARAQQRRLFAGELGAEGVEAVDREYSLHVNDVVMVRDAAYQFSKGPGGQRPRRVENGTIGIVDSVDVKRQRVNVYVEEPGCEPRVVEFDSKLLAQQGSALRLAYAFHPFPLQGATVNDVSELGGHKSQNKEGSYTAGTRAKFNLNVYVDRESLGTKRTEQERYEQYGKLVSRSQRVLASIRVGESGEIIALEAPPLQAVPAFARRDVDRPRAPSERLAVHAPAEADLSLLGRERVGRVKERVAALGVSVSKLSDDELLALRQEYGEPFDGFDRPAARETLALERELLVAARRVKAARSQVDALDAQAPQGTDSRRRRSRREAPAEAEARSKLDDAESELKLLIEREQVMRRDQVHLDTWLAGEGERLARCVAVERELQSRYELEVAQEAEIDAAASEAEPDESIAAGRTSYVERARPPPEVGPEI